MKFYIYSCSTLFFISDGTRRTNMYNDIDTCCAVFIRHGLQINSLPEKYHYNIVREITMKEIIESVPNAEEYL